MSDEPPIHESLRDGGKEGVNEEVKEVKEEVKEARVLPQHNVNGMLLGLFDEIEKARNMARTHLHRCFNIGGAGSSKNIKNKYQCGYANCEVRRYVRVEENKFVVREVVCMGTR